jgi:predicted aspartyl protease
MTHTSVSALPGRPIEVFCAYSHKDEALRDELETHLSSLKRSGSISLWHDRRISGGREWANEINDHLNGADLILLLVSADFIASNYCYDKEVDRAMVRHQQGEARVVPVILRDCDWDFTRFSKLQALPRDGKPVGTWPSRDEAFKNVAVGIRRVVEELGRGPARPWREPRLVSAGQPGASVQSRKYVTPIRSARDLLLYGPRIKIKFGPPLLRTTLVGPEPTRAGFLLADALLDSGAARTVLTPEAVERAGLTKIDEINLISVGGDLKAGVYAASLQFPHSGLSAIEMIAVVCCKLAHPLYRCLLGRDVLSRWTLTYDGPVGTWQISEGATAPGIEPPEGFDPDPWREWPRVAK